MGKVIDLSGKPVMTTTRTVLCDAGNKDIQAIIDHVSYLNQEGRAAAVMVAVIQPDGTKTKAYAISKAVDPDTITGLLDRLKDMIRNDSELQDD